MFMPSERNWREMKHEAAGLWPAPINNGDEYALLLKAPTHVIKSVYRGVPAQLKIATASTPLGHVVATTLVILDDIEAPLLLSGVERYAEEILALHEILRLHKTITIFFDELSRPVARATCFLDEEQTTSILRRIEVHTDWYVGPWHPVLDKMLDEIQGEIDPHLAREPKYSPVTGDITLTFNDFETNKIATIGANGVAYRFRIDDPEEGRGFEQSVWHLLEGLFGTRIYMSPKVDKGQARRELTDILCHTGNSVIAIQAKAVAVLSTDVGRGTQRRASNIRKQVKKGLKQAQGALRSISVGLPISSEGGERIAADIASMDVKLGVVMVSDFLPGVDWEEVAADSIGASKEVRCPIVVLDLRELRVLVGVSRSPEDLVLQLLHRFETMFKNGNALIRASVVARSPHDDGVAIADWHSYSDGPKDPQDDGT